MQRSSDLVEHLMECGLMDDKARELIDAIALYVGNRDDHYYCSICFLNGGSDTPDLNVCESCVRCYCDECILARKCTCLCGDTMELDHPDRSYEILADGVRFLKENNML